MEAATSEQSNIEHSNDEYRSIGTEYPIANLEYPMSK